MSKQILTTLDNAAPGASAMTRRFGLAAGLVGVAFLASACGGPLRQQAVVNPEPVEAPAQGKRISPEGPGGLRLPDGTRVALDQSGGFELPNGQYVRRDRSGTLILPNGARCVPDRQGGFICP